MPHIIIEYSNSLKEQMHAANLLQKAHQAVLDSNLFTPAAVKARSLGFDDYILHEGSSFIHVTVSILQGCSVEERLHLSESVFSVVKEAVADADKISVNIHEMNKETYKK